MSDYTLPGPTDPKLERLLSREEIDEVVQRLASELDSDYSDRHPLLVGVLRGSFVFLADLIRLLKTPVSVEFVRVSSYPRGTVSSGQPRILLGLPMEVVRGRDVVLVEDIVDTGTTTEACLSYLRRSGPASLEVCALLDKPHRRRVPLPIKYRGIVVPDRFLVGYGLDLDQRYRQLSEIYAVEEE